jgi:hypothetical protein
MRLTSIILAIGLALGAVTLVPGPAVAKEPIERFTAFAVNLGGPTVGAPIGRARTGTVDIAIERWSTPEERDQLTAALQEGGSDALLKALQKIKHPAGYIRRPTSIGYPLRFAWQIQGSDGQRRIIIATDRPISFLEARASTRSLDYPFMLIELRLDAEGKGEGKLLPLARVTANHDHVVEIENYAQEPVRLTEVRKES